MVWEILSKLQRQDSEVKMARKYETTPWYKSALLWLGFENMSWKALHGYQLQYSLSKPWLDCLIFGLLELNASHLSHDSGSGSGVAVSVVWYYSVIKCRRPYPSGPWVLIIPQCPLASNIPVLFLQIGGVGAPRGLSPLPTNVAITLMYAASSYPKPQGRRRPFRA